MTIIQRYLETGKSRSIAYVRERRRDVVYNGVEAREFKTAVGMWERLLMDMESALGDGPWLVGKSYSLADAAYTPYLTRLDHLNLLGWISQRPKLSDWYDRIRARPSYEAAIIKWENQKYLSLMREKGAEVWPRIQRIIEAL